MKTSLAPIVLFVYNRPWHTLQTLEALSKNDLADQSVLYIYADGPKNDTNEDTLAKINEVREIIKKQDWCKEVHIIESEKNKGLADSIVEGVTRIINKYGKIIVLEDDIVTSPHFLRYMNDALFFYEKEDKVMHVSAFTPKTTGAERLPETYFLRFMSCWGWGTWRRAWDKLNTDTTFLYKEVPKHPYYKKYFDVGSSVKMFNQIEDNYIGLIKTWAVKWYASIFLNNGLCLYPQYALAKNIGFDGTGVNCGIDAKSANQHQSLELKTPIKVSPIKIEECHVGYKYLKRYYLYGEDSSLKMKIITNINKFRFLRKIYRFYFKVKRLI